jgi:hypothetical protein
MVWPTLRKEGRLLRQMTKPIDPPLTDEALAKAKADNLREFPHHIVDGDPTKQVYTCETCDERRTCPFSMDPYNTDCECLASK